MSRTAPAKARPLRMTGVPQRPGRPPRTATHPPRARRLRLGSDRRLNQGVDLADLAASRPVAEPAPPPPLPDPTALGGTVVRAAVEVLHGGRPAAQLARWLSPAVLDQLTLRTRLLREAGVEPTTTRPVHVRRVRVERRDDSAEVAVVLDDQGRVRAAAARLEAWRGQWRVTVLELG